jgi:hypothetical protein
MRRSDGGRGRAAAGRSGGSTALGLFLDSDLVGRLHRLRGAGAARGGCQREERPVAGGELRQGRWRGPLGDLGTWHRPPHCITGARCTKGQKGTRGTGMEKARAVLVAGEDRMAS